jgi:hypothetical protein
MGYYCTHLKCLPNPEEESPRISRASYSCLPPKREPSGKYFYDGPDQIFLFTQNSSFTSGSIHRQSYWIVCTLLLEFAISVAAISVSMKVAIRVE